MPTRRMDMRRLRELMGLHCGGGLGKRNLGAATVRPWEQKDMVAEDFAYFVQPDLKAPGFYFAVGGTPQSAFDAAQAGGPRVAGDHSGLLGLTQSQAS